jgi:hypothetical protein
MVEADDFMVIQAHVFYLLVRMQVIDQTAELLLFTPVIQIGMGYFTALPPCTSSFQLII